MEDDKFIQFQQQMNLTMPKISKAGGGNFKLIPNAVYPLEELYGNMLCATQIYIKQITLFGFA